MKYAAYMTRGEHWYFDSRDLSPITEAEWLDYARRDPELRLITHNRLRCLNTGQEWTQLRKDERLWDWEPAGGRSSTGPHAYAFEWHRNGIIVRCLDPELLAKAKAIARVFNARVIGDDDDVL